MNRSVAGSVRSRRSTASSKRSDRFSHVKAVVRTGQSSTRSPGLTTGEVLRRRDEIFGRVGAKALAALLVEAEPEPESLYEIAETRRAPVVVVAATDDPQQREAFVLLDVRSEEQYEACHIHAALHFDAMLLRQDRVPTAYWALKGAQRERQLIIYSDSDRLAAQAAKAFVEKGWSCATILSGGMNRFARLFSHHVEGDGADDVLAELEFEFNDGGSPMSTRGGSARRRGGSARRGGGSSARSVASRSSRRSRQTTRFGRK
jgi:centrosomal protein CEP41